MKHVALLGRRGTGKTSTAGALMARGYTRMSWADPVKDIARLAYGHIEKSGTYEVTRETIDGPLPVMTSGRDILQRIGTDAIRRHVDQDFWIKVGIRRLDASEGVTWVNDDTRFPNEVEALRSRGFLIVYLVCDEQLRRDRLGDDWSPDADQHPSETSVSAYDADIVVRTDLGDASWVAERIIAHGS